jgi:hypothetical protein
MLHRIREPFGKAGLIVALVALVASFMGGAYAATTLTGQQKKEVKKIAKRFAGKAGQVGPVGQGGAQGPKGDTGAAGANGTNGTDGKEGKKGESVTIVPLSPGDDPECPNGGTKLVNNQVASYACSGGGGGGGEYPETLPSGRSLTGYWEVLGTAAVHPFPGMALTTISFPLPLAAAPTETVLIPPSGGTEEQKDKCPGSPFSPAATSGVLCLYQTFGEPATLIAGGPSQFGAELIFNETDKTYGSWAVKAP